MLRNVKDLTSASDNISIRKIEDSDPAQSYRDAEQRAGILRPDADALRAKRLEVGVSVERAAEMCGLEPHQYAALEAGRRSLTKRQARALVAAFAEEA